MRAGDRIAARKRGQQLRGEIEDHAPDAGEDRLGYQRFSIAAQKMAQNGDDRRQRAAFPREFIREDRLDISVGGQVHRLFAHTCRP